MRIVAIECLQDNYAYLVICEATKQCAVVDPSEAAPVTAAIEREGVTLKAIWNTHHHWDHTGGNKALCAAHDGIEVVAHESDKGRVHGQTVFANDGDTVSVGEVSAEIIFNPGHTLGAISYYINPAGIVFTGDTLFGAGCGRTFEGTAEQMHASLSRLAALPEKTLVYCGHEYTASNLRFAAAVEPDSEAISARQKDVAEKRAGDQPTVPFTIAEERATNPFLRADVAEVAAAAQKRNKNAREPAAIFGTLRKWKDKF